MAKDPAFLFYSQDFIVGVQTMTFEDRGKFITILAQMHQQGRINEKSIRFLVGNISDELKAKFLIDEKGLWFNRRLEEEIKKRKKFTESRRKNGQKGGRPKKENKKPNGYSKENLIEDEIDIENDDEKKENESREIKYPYDSDDFIGLWNTWKEYKRNEHQFSYKSKASEQAALVNLNRLSNGNEKIATEIIKQSMANGWKGFFELKSGKNENNKQKFFDLAEQYLNQT